MSGFNLPFHIDMESSIFKLNLTNDDYGQNHN